MPERETDPEVYGQPAYTDVLWDTEVYGEWTEEDGIVAVDTPTTSDSADRTGSFHRTGSQTVTLSDAAVIGTLRGRTASDSITISGTVVDSAEYPRIRQYATAATGNTATLGSAIIQGHGLLAMVGARASGGIGFSTTGWTHSPDGDVFRPDGGDHTDYYYKRAGASESTSLVPATGDASGIFIELDQAVRLDQHAFATGDERFGGVLSASITASAHSIIFAVATDGTGGGWGGQTFTPPAGWTELLDNQTSDHPTIWVGYTTSAFGGTVTANPVCTNVGLFSIQIVSFVPDGRSSTDTVALSDSASRVVTLNRTASDNPTSSDVIRPTRTADSFVFLTDAATAGQNKPRTASDTVTLSDTAFRGKRASASDSITVSGSATRTGTISRTAADNILVYGSAARYLPPDSPSPGDPAATDIVITYDGVDITSDVVIEEAEFISLVNGQPGSCRLKVRDDNRDKTFITGKRISLDIGENRVWTGYLSAVKRSYAFDAYSPMTRFLILEGVDINVLFGRRFVNNKAHPTVLNGPTFGSNTTDTAAIHYLVTNWLDLDGDEIDVGGYVENVGPVNLSQKANFWQGGNTWGQAMQTLARLEATVFYINPNRQLVWTDVDTPNAPWVMTDTPSGGNQIGYREMAIQKSASHMVNDAYVWGTGGGSPIPVFSQETSTSSIAEHGLWQFGSTYQGVWKQDTADKIAYSLVNGSPLAKRGQKNDQVTVEVTTYAPGFIAGQKIDFTSNAHDFSDVIPIRKMVVTFPGGHPKYRLTLSHEIDLPINLIDPLIPTGFDFGGIPPIVIDGSCGPTQACFPADVPPFDSYNRSVSSGGGTSDYGLPYTYTGTRTSVITSSVPGGPAMVFNGGSPVTTSWHDELHLTADGDEPWNGSSYTAYIKFATQVVATGTLGELTVTFTDVTHGGVQRYIDILMRNTAGGSVYGWNDVSGTDSDTAKTDWVANRWYILKISHVPGTSFKFVVYEEDAGDPGTWMGQLTDPGGVPMSGTSTLQFDFHTGSSLSTGVTNIFIGELDFDYPGKATGDTGCFEVVENPYLVQTVGGADEAFCTIAPGYGDCHVPTDQQFQLYHGATYRVEYLIHYSGTDWYYIAGLPPGGGGTMLVGGTLNDEGFPPQYFYSTYVTPDFGNPWVYATAGLYHQPRTGTDGAFGEVSARIYYVSGYDPRFVFDPNNPPAGPDPCQTTNDHGIVAISNTVFQTSYPYQAGTLRVFITADGVEFEIVGFEETDPANGIFTLEIGLVEGETIRATYFQSSNVPNTTTGEQASHVCRHFVGDGSTTQFDISADGAGYIPGSTEVYLDGFRQTPFGVQYTETNPTTGLFTFTSAPSVGADIYVCWHWARLDGFTGGITGGQFSSKVS